MLGLVKMEYCYAERGIGERMSMLLGSGRVVGCIDGLEVIRGSLHCL